MEEENRLVKRALMAACCVIVILAGLNFAMGYAAAEAAKDFRPASTESSDSHGRRMQVEYFEFLSDETGQLFPTC